MVLTKPNMTPKKQTRIDKPKDTITQNKHKKLNTGLVALNDDPSEKRSGLFVQLQSLFFFK